MATTKSDRRIFSTQNEMIYINKYFWLSPMIDLDHLNIESRPI